MQKTIVGHSPGRVVPLVRRRSGERRRRNHDNGPQTDQADYEGKERLKKERMQANRLTSHKGKLLSPNRDGRSAAGKREWSQRNMMLP